MIKTIVLGESGLQPPPHRGLSLQETELVTGVIAITIGDAAAQSGKHTGGVARIVGIDEILDEGLGVDDTGTSWEGVSIASGSARTLHLDAIAMVIEDNLDAPGGVRCQPLDCQRIVDAHGHNADDPWPRSGGENPGMLQSVMLLEDGAQPPPDTGLAYESDLQVLRVVAVAISDMGREHGKDGGNVVPVVGGKELQGERPRRIGDCARG